MPRIANGSCARSTRSLRTVTAPARCARSAKLWTKARCGLESARPNFPTLLTVGPKRRAVARRASSLHCGFRFDQRERAMRAAYYEKNGPAQDVLHVGEVETPKPGPGEVRIKLKTS